MAEAAILTEQMRSQAIGNKGLPVTVEVEKGAILRFAQAIEDPNPLWNDEVQARKSRYGGLITPPTFLRSLSYGRPPLPFDLPLERRLDGGSEWEYFEPVHPGDRITVVAELVDMTERQGRLGPMVFLVFQVTYTNQFGQVVATQRSTNIWY
ncbi:MAG: MaoC family dehydratase N-terminal domain-containing protein [Dehalococcoidia bacterium]